MTRRRKRSVKTRGRARKRAILLFGESDNDRRAIKELAEGLAPALQGSIQIRRQPMVLVKDVSTKELRQRAQSLSDQVRADRVRFDVRDVLVHEDCDAVEPAHEEIAKKYDSDFAHSDYRVHPVLPAWELEAWWLLWPGALSAYRSSWRAPTEMHGRQVGKIENAKETLKRALLPRELPAARKKTFRTYQESDSPGIAQTVRRMGLLEEPAAKSDSYACFRKLIASLAR